MSIFGGACARYSQDKKQIATEYLKNHLIVSAHISGLKPSECKDVCEAILQARDSDGKISLRKVCSILRDLKQNAGKIQEGDRKKIMEIMEKYFAE